MKARLDGKQSRMLRRASGGTFNCMTDRQAKDMSLRWNLIRLVRAFNAEDAFGFWLLPFRYDDENDYFTVKTFDIMSYDRALYEDALEICRTDANKNLLSRDRLPLE